MLKKRFFKTKDEVEVTFEITAEADRVELVGDFNNWEPIAMAKAKASDAPFRAKVRLPKEGEFQFRYRVNEAEWRNDEAADAYYPNEHGSDNSVVFTYDN